MNSRELRKVRSESSRVESSHPQLFERIHPRAHGTEAFRSESVDPKSVASFGLDDLGLVEDPEMFGDLRLADTQPFVWYEMPGYAKSAKSPVLCFFRVDDAKFVTFGLSEPQAPGSRKRHDHPCPDTYMNREAYSRHGCVRSRR